jgi:hypothetical protein
VKSAALTLSVFASLGTAVAAAEANDDWRLAYDGTLYGYATSTRLRSDSVLNPDNRIAHLPQRSEVAELRVNVKAEDATLRLTARAIALVRARHDDLGTDRRSEAYFSQWQARVRLSDEWNAAAGRDVLNWGPGQFRSPSSPFYFDNGRNDPLRELVGMDSMKLSWTPNMQSSALLANIVGPGHSGAQADASRDVWRDAWLAKFDRRGDEWAYAVLAAKAPELPTFYGAYGQVTLSDALMLYGEFGSSARVDALQSPADGAQPFTMQKVSSRRATALVGMSYTFDDGKSLAVEYLHDGHGYTPAQEQAYFQRAAVSPAMALGLMPSLLGRDYAHLVWQSNMMDERGYWRLMYTRNFSDRSNEYSLYAERTLGSRISAYVLATLPQGSARQELPALFDNRITLGLKIALP